MPALLRNRWLIGLAALALLLGVALLASTRLVPALVRKAATDWVETNLGLPLALGDIRVDPFALSLDVSDIAVPAGEAPIVRIGHVHADFAFSSLFAGDWRFDAIRIEQPEIDARIGPDGKLNLLALVPPADDEPLPALLIADLAVRSGQARFRDETLGPEAAARVLPLDFRLQNLHTRKDAGGRFALTAASDKGETIAWSGTASMAPVASRGGISLKNLSVTRTGAFLENALPTRFLAGSADVSLTYHLSYADGLLRLSAESPALTVRSIGTDVRRDVLNANLSAGAAVYKDLAARYEARDGAAPDWSVAVGGIGASDILVTGKGPAAGESVRVKRMSLGQVSASSKKPGGTADSFTVEGLDFTLTREAGGTVGILRLLPAPTPGAAQEPAAPIAIRRIRMKDARIIVLEESTPRPGRYELAPLDLEVRGLDTASPKPLAIAARGRINGRPFTVAGKAAPDGTSADAAITLDALPLKLALPYLPDFPAVELISGTLGIDGTARYRLKAGGAPDVGFVGEVTVSDFRLKELVRDSDLFAFRTFLLSGIRYDGRSATIERGRLNAPAGQLALLPDGQFNYGFLLDEGTSIEAAREATGPKAPASTRAERREARARQEAEKAARAAARAAARTAPRPQAVEPDLPVTLKRLDIENGRLSFADLTIEPSFAANISNLRGAITNLSNRPRQLSTIALKGQVLSRFAPVTIDGKANLFDYAADTDVRFLFRNIDLTVFNPYSGEYAGYAIASGRLTADLDYRIIDSALQANHKVEIADLVWGTKADGKRAPFPVRFATSVMKDRDGVIRLELPVSGTVDDPEFRLGPLIWKALGRFLGRIATAPFRAIGGLFGGDDEPEKLAFTPGSTVLPEEAAKVLPEVGKFLSQRVGVTLVIPAGPGTEADARAIAQERIEAALMVKERKANPQAASASLAVPERHARLLRLYRIQFGRAPAFAEVRLPAEGGADPRAARLEAQIRQMMAELEGAWLPSETELAALGRARAAAVETALLATPGLTPDRVRLAPTTALADKGGKPVMELKMEDPPEAAPEVPAEPTRP